MSEAITEATFPQEVLQADKPVLIDFWAEWCGPCRILSPIVDELGNEYTGKIKVGKVNVDENPQLAQQYNVLSIPTLILFKGGQIAAHSRPTPGAACKTTARSRAGCKARSYAPAPLRGRPANACRAWDGRPIRRCLNCSSPANP